VSLLQTQPYQRPRQTLEAYIQVQHLLQDGDSEGGNNEFAEYDDEFIDDSEFHEYYGGDWHKPKHSGFFINQVLPASLKHDQTQYEAHGTLKPLHNVETRFCCPQTFFHLVLECWDDVSELRQIDVLGVRRAVMTYKDTVTISCTMRPMHQVSRLSGCASHQSLFLRTAELWTRAHSRNKHTALVVSSLLSAGRN